MFGKRKCDAAPVYRDPLRLPGADAERAAIATMKCASGSDYAVAGAAAPTAAALVIASEETDAVWMYSRRLECTRCKKICSLPVSVAGNAPAPNDIAVRSKARPDFYALQHAFLPEWFLNKPELAISILTTKLDAWQAQTMTQFAGVVERTEGQPMPITRVEVVSTPGETSSVLIDFLPPRAPVEAHYALLVGGPSPRFFLSEKTHLGENAPLQEIAGLSEWAFTDATRNNMKHTAMALLPDISRRAFFEAAAGQLKRSFA